MIRGQLDFAGGVCHLALGTASPKVAQLLL